MKNGAGGQRQWVLAIGGTVVVLIGMLFLFRTPRETRVGTIRPAKPTVAAVTLVDMKPNDAPLTDPTPLFLPTKWNAAENALPANTQREPGGSFQGYPAKLAFEEADLKLNFPAAVTVPARPADALAADRSSMASLGIGKSDKIVAQLTSRNAFIEILAAGNGERLLAQPLADADPPAAAWQPMEFLLAVDPAGLVGPPILTESSQVAAVDGYFQNYLGKTLHVGQRLAPGFYRVCIGP